MLYIGSQSPFYFSQDPTKACLYEQWSLMVAAQRKLMRNGISGLRIQRSVGDLLMKLQNVYKKKL